MNKYKILRFTKEIGKYLLAGAVLVIMVGAEIHRSENGCPYYVNCVVIK